MEICYYYHNFNVYLACPTEWRRTREPFLVFWMSKLCILGDESERDQLFYKDSKLVQPDMTSKLLLYYYYYYYLLIGNIFFNQKKTQTLH